MGYRPKGGYDVSELVSKVTPEIIWPWACDRGRTNSAGSSPTIAEDGVLEFEASVAIVILEQLRSPERPSMNRERFAGWPFDTGGRVKMGLQECILLSRVTLDKHDQSWGFQPLNVLLVERDDDGVFSRKGIGILRDDDWMMFSPKREKVRLK
jgi:hypothetical protein